MQAKLMIALTIAVSMFLVGVVVKCYTLSKEVNALEEQVVILTMDNAALKKNVEVYQAQADVFESESAQTNDLLDSCYKKLASQAQELEAIVTIPELPQPGELKTGDKYESPENSIAVDFFNTQLRSIK